MSVMRVGLGILVLGTLAAGTGRAQDHPITVGVVGGINSATLSGEDTEGSERKIGIALGGYLSFGIHRNLAIETGMLYSQRGAKDTDPGAVLKASIDYLEIPLLLSARMPGEGSVTPFFSAGPALAIKTRCSFTVNGTAEGSGCSSIEDELNIGLKSTDLGLVGSLGVDIQAFRVALRYFLGLSTIDSDSPSYEIKNNVFTLLAGYSFRVR